MIKKDTFENITLTFDLQGKSITGILNGSYKTWSFESDSPAFLKIIPSGRYINQTMRVSDLSKEIAELFKAILRTAEDLGFDMHEKELT